MQIVIGIIIDSNIDIDSLPSLTADDFTTISRVNTKLIGPVAKLRTKVKNLVKGGSGEPMITVSTNVKQMLLNDVRGKTILKYYQDHDELTNDMQTLLIDVVLDHNFNCEMPSRLPVTEIRNRTQEICQIFPNENEVFQNNEYLKSF